MAAPALHWASQIVSNKADQGQGPITAWFKIIRVFMSEEGLKNASIYPSDVNGYTDDTIVAVTMVQLNSEKSMAIVMAAGLHGKTFCDTMVKRISKVTFTPL
jgi:hypothetical protein